MNKKFLGLSTGFALFSMFFGSGNLVFPIAAAQLYPGHTAAVFLGILLTGVCVPFLGVYGMALYEGSIDKFFQALGKRGPFWITLLCLSLMGPFGVMARCLTVAHGSIDILLPNTSLVYTSLTLCAIIYLFARNKGSILHALGNLLTPILLLSIAALAYWGLAVNPTVEVAAASSQQLSNSWRAFQHGFFQGYQTMDLLAAFFFSSFIIQQVKQFSPRVSPELSPGQSTQRIILQSSLVGGGLLALVYLCMVALGDRYSLYVQGLPNQELLAKIAFVALGNLAAPVVCTAIILACLTTAIILTSLFATFLNREVCNQKLGERLSLIITLAIGFLVSTLDFAGIASFVGPILTHAYPALIVLTLVNISHKLWGTPLTHWPATLTLALKLCL